MNNRHLKSIIAFGTVVLTALCVVQMYWFRKAFDVEERQFDHSIQIALLSVADSVSANAEVKKLSSNFYFVATETALNDQAVDTLLKSALLKRNLQVDYELGIYNADDDTLVYGQYVEATKKHRMEQDLYAKTSGSEKNFAVYFPHKGSYIISQLNIWMFSTLALLLMMCFFAYAIATLLRERRFAQLKSDFINNMTHEFKTPVTNIGITGEIIRKKVPEMANVGVYLDILLKENEKLRSKIDQVLLGSSADYGLRPALQRLDIHQLILQCAEAFELKVGERNGRIELAFHANSNFVLGDRELLTQAINNVIDNAEKYSPREPHIRIATRDERNGIGIEIIDDGIGIPPKLSEKVFEKFFRVEYGNLHNVKGFGLGLSFVKNVIRSHRGRIRLSSELNKGTEVKIFLPAI